MEKIKIYKTLEIIQNVYAEPKFRCPKCNCVDVVDLKSKSTWQCLRCGELFKEPIITFDEGQISPNCKFIKIDDIFKWAKEYEEDTFDDFLAELDYEQYKKLWDD